MEKVGVVSTGGVINHDPLIRFWCSECKEFTVQKLHGGCLTCGTVTKDYNISDVPEEKINEQRERYKQVQKSKYNNKMLHYIPMIFGQISEFNEDYFSKHKGEDIYETDAGLKKIEEYNQLEHEKRIKERDDLIEEYDLYFKKANRNDNCPCGAKDENGNPLKYKKCCMKRFNRI